MSNGSAQLGADTFPDPIGHFGAPWRPFWILQAMRRCRRWASAPFAARLVLWALVIHNRDSFFLIDACSSVICLWSTIMFAIVCCLSLCNPFKFHSFQFPRSKNLSVQYFKISVIPGPSIISFQFLELFWLRIFIITYMSVTDSNHPCYAVDTLYSFLKGKRREIANLAPTRRECSSIM